MSKITGHDIARFTIEKIDHRQKKIAQQIYSVFQRSYSIEADMLGVTSFPPLLNTVQDIKNRKTVFYGYWLGQDLAAVTELDISDELLDICSFVVDPEYFRMGVGSRLLEAVLSHFPDKNKIVETGVDNHPAIGLYEKKGFKKGNRWLTEIGIAKVQLRMSKR